MVLSRFPLARASTWAVHHRPPSRHQHQHPHTHKRSSVHLRASHLRHATSTTRKAPLRVAPVPSQSPTPEFQFNYSALEKPHVQNDTVTLHRRYAQSAKMKLAISYALAQSTKLSVYEKRVVDIVLETKNLPETLAENGTVDITTVDIAKLIGKVFLQKSAVNLLSSVLDTPEFFWHAPDSFQALYQRLSEYLELPARVELLNSRFSVLQEMLDMLRDHQNNHHSVRLEMIVIYLIVIEVVVGLMELLGLFGLVGNEGGGARR
ncbi:MAG: hypothetical protein WDW38_000046 [Sanguina aurantia]